jgi:putative Mg2+ transporter-C (MgtC) family protein
MDLTLQAELAARLVLAAVLGAAVGVERELHEHPAGMRTHLLVAVGCALFTVLSIYGFEVPVAGAGDVDPSRVAAQIVTGIGFLGAGAILKYGTSIRGLTTAASLWATAAIGIAAGTGQWILGIVGTAIVLFSLWPLNRVARAIRLRNDRTIRLRVVMSSLDGLAAISAVLDQQRAHIEGVQTVKQNDRYELELDLRLSDQAKPDAVLTAIHGVDGVDVLESDRAVE